MWIIVAVSSLCFLSLVATSPRQNDGGPPTADDDLFSRLGEQSSDVHYNFYNFRPPSMFPEKGGGGVDVGGIEQDPRASPPKERRGRRFQLNHFSDSSSSIETEKRYKTYGKPKPDFHDQNPPSWDHKSDHPAAHHHHEDHPPSSPPEWTGNRRRLDMDVDRINRWRAPDQQAPQKGNDDEEEYELNFPPPKSGPPRPIAHGRPREAGRTMGEAGRRAPSRWDRKGLPMDVSWYQDQHHGPGARDGGMFGHKVTKMWHVMPGGGFVMTEERDKKKKTRGHHMIDRDHDDDDADGDGYYGDVVGQSKQQRRPVNPVHPVTLSVTAGRPSLTTTTMMTTTTKKTTKKNHHGDRKMILMTTDMGMGMGTSMEQRLHRRIRKLQVMMSVLQSQRMQNNHHTMLPINN